jgi:hypothetical protein
MLCQASRPSSPTRAPSRRLLRQRAWLNWDRRVDSRRPLVRRLALQQRRLWLPACRAIDQHDGLLDRIAELTHVSAPAPCLEQLQHIRLQYRIWIWAARLPKEVAGQQRNILAPLP